MKTLEETIDGIEYEFRLNETTHIVDVLKDGIPTYKLSIRAGYWACNCWGWVRHRKPCKHLKRLPLLLRQPSNGTWLEQVAQDYEDEMSGLPYRSLKKERGDREFSRREGRF